MQPSATLLLDVVISDLSTTARRKINAAGGRLSIGRHPGCSIVLAAPGISRRHASLEVAGDQLRVLDDSLHGTLVGDEFVHARAAQVPLDTPVRIGAYTLLFSRSAPLRERLRDCSARARAQLTRRMPSSEQRALVEQALHGSFEPFRPHTENSLSLARLVELDCLTSAAASTLQAFVVARFNILVTGGPCSGKTSLLDALASFIPEPERKVATRAGSGVRELSRASQRLRPDHLILGEIQGPEAFDVIQAMANGQGCMGTLQGSHPRGALARLETLGMLGAGAMPVPALRHQIGAGVQIIVQLALLRDGSRKLTHISEVAGFDAQTNRYDVRDLFALAYRPGAGTTVERELVPTGSALTGRARPPEPRTLLGAPLQAAG